MASPALRLFAGPVAAAAIRADGLQPQQVRAFPAAAGGPKGLILNPLDRLLLGHWLNRPGRPPLHLVGASIGAWRMASAMAPDADSALARMAQDYIDADYTPPAGQPLTPAFIAERYRQLLAQHFDTVTGGQIDRLLSRPGYRLHLLTTAGRSALLQRERRGATLAGYAAAWCANAIHRRGLGGWLQRVLFSDPRDALPLPWDDLPTQQVPLRPDNLLPALQASGSIPFWLSAVHDIPGAAPGAHWDGGITDYHLHWPWTALLPSEGRSPPPGAHTPLVLYPHFQPHLVPGWLDKPWKHRHRPTPGLDNLLLLCPDPAWIATLPGGKLPDRNDFKALPTLERQQRWRIAVAESQRLADEFAQWLEDGCPADRLEALG
jgi:hypothetical protein